ncbi:MAG: phosphate ABC transporter permease subunit PstC [Leptospirales bacterium]
MNKKTFWPNLFENYIIRFSGILTILIMLLIVVFLMIEGFPFLFEYNFFKFIFTSDWYPLSSKYGALPLIFGSFFVTFLAAIMAVPLSLATALFISEIATPSLRTSLKVSLEILASVPSVVFGFLGILILGPFFESAFGIRTGLNAFTAAFLLAFMAIPTIASVAEESLQSVPKALREGSLALGANKFQTMMKITLPAAQSGIIAGVMLGVGRAIGETMTVMMVAGGSAQISLGIFEPVRTITGTIASEMGEVIHGDEHYHALFMLGFILFLITLTINTVSSMIIKKIKENKG